MKTLDEVIQEVAKRRDLDNDIYHYLKKLKRIEAKIEKIAIGNVEDTLSKMDNPAITWDELKQMEGKPVWLEYGTFSDSGWAFISEISEKGSIEFLLPWGLRLIMHEGAIGKTWQAYRKERE